MKPRVLLVSFNRLIPADQGNARRVLQLATLYGQLGYEVDLLYHAEEGFDAGLSSALSARFSRVVMRPSRSPKLVQAQQHCRITDWYDHGLEATARDMHTLRGYQVLHVNYVWYAPLLQAFGPDVVKVLDTHDIFANRAQKYRDAGMYPQWFCTSEAEEDAALRCADVALAIQRDEGAELAARGHTNVHCLNWVEPQLRPFERAPGHRPLTFGYLGSANDWNVLSMQRFVAALRQRGSAPPHPIVVAGAICRHLRETPGIIRLGFVKELHTFYDAIDVAINPMVGGTGLKIKTVEPLSYGKPVLSTPAGVQGLGHLWTLPVPADPEALLDTLCSQFPPGDDAPLNSLLQQAAATRAALDAEYAQQVSVFRAALLAHVPEAAA
jgi:hypothetical protein